MSPVHLEREPDGEDVGLWILLFVAAEDGLHRGARLVGGARVDVDAVRVARPEVEGEERLENSRLWTDRRISLVLLLL